MKREIASQDHGEAILSYTLPTSEGDLRDLEEWLALVLKRVRREVEARTLCPPQEPTS